MKISFLPKQIATKALLLISEQGLIFATLLNPLKVFNKSPKYFFLQSISDLYLRYRLTLTIPQITLCSAVACHSVGTGRLFLVFRKNAVIKLHFLTNAVGLAYFVQLDFRETRLFRDSKTIRIN